MNPKIQNKQKNRQSHPYSIACILTNAKNVSNTATRRSYGISLANTTLTSTKNR